MEGEKYETEKRTEREEKTLCERNIERKEQRERDRE
jgi:hypothetical protein